MPAAPGKTNGRRWGSRGVIPVFMGMTVEIHPPYKQIAANSGKLFDIRPG